MTNDDRKLIQEAMTQRSWLGIENAMKEYTKGLKQDSIRKQTQFDTIWEAAYSEGGEYHIRQFFIYLFNEGKKYD